MVRTNEHMELEQKLEIAKEALDSIACWNEDGKNAKLTEPESAKIAREALFRMQMAEKVLTPPKDWRTGQTIFNFLEWILANGLGSNAQSFRMADPFHVSDAQWNLYWERFVKEVNK